MGELIGIWISAFLTLAIFSFLYRDNPFYKFAEHFFVGVSAGYWFAFYYQSVIVEKLWKPLVAPQTWDHYLLGIPLVLSIMMLLRLAPKIGWISRWPLAFIIGTGAGINFITYLQSNALKQINATIQNPIKDIGAMANNIATTGHIPHWFDILHSFDALLILIGVITGLIYFFFSKEHKGAFGFLAKIGIYFLMISFGASFGYTVMARVSLLIGRFQFLLGDWLHIIK